MSELTTAKVPNVIRLLAMMACNIILSWNLQIIVRKLYNAESKISRIEHALLNFQGNNLRS